MSESDVEIIRNAGTTIAQLLAQAEGLRCQHQRDSAELRALCAARDEARDERDALRARIAELSRE